MKLNKIIVLIILLGVTITGCAADGKNEQPVNPVNLSIEETRELIESQEDLFILDVRTTDEFNQGHIEGAEQISVDDLKDRMGELEEYKDKPVLVYCRSGNRSSKAVDILLDNGFTNIYHMDEGFMNWR